MKLSIIICIIGIIFIVVLIIQAILLWNNLIEKNKNGKHFCNHCKTGYILNKEERALTHCPDCGRPLTFHKDNPYFLEEIELERPNQIEDVFEDFNDKGE